MLQSFDVAISIGLNCRARYQLKRVYGDGPWCPAGVFDWQISRLSSVGKYLRHDFAGAFELADLQIVKGEVQNVRFGTRHPHEFPEHVTPESLAHHYAEARSRHDHLATKTRTVLEGSQS